MEYRKWLCQAIDTFKDIRVTSLLSHIFNHDEIITKLEKELTNLDLALEIENEPMSEPQFLQSLIHDLDSKDSDISYEEYLQAFAYGVAVKKYRQKWTRMCQVVLCMNSRRGNETRKVEYEVEE